MKRLIAASRAVISTLLISSALCSPLLVIKQPYAAEPGTPKGEYRPPWPDCLDGATGPDYRPWCVPPSPSEARVTKPSNPPVVYALPPVDAGPVWIVDIKRHGSSITLNGYLNEGVPVTFMLDTGASAISIPRALAARIGAKEIRKTRVQYADGRTALESVVMIKRLQVGSVYVENIEAVVGDGDVPLLGKNFLDYFASYEINNKLAQLILRQQ